MKVIEGKKILEDDDMVAVYKSVINHHYGLNAILTGVTVSADTMTFGEFKKRYDRGDFASDDGVCAFRYDVMPL